MTTATRILSKPAALRFVVLLGVVSLFADMTYEGARSVTGPFLGHLGATATVVGIAAGSGELLGYGLRLVSGYRSDRTGKYWTITLLGYTLNLLAVPSLALAVRWEIAVVLIMLERSGKAIRTPARNAMLAHATTEMGRGWDSVYMRRWIRPARWSGRCWWRQCFTPRGVTHLRLRPCWYRRFYRWQPL